MTESGGKGSDPAKSAGKDPSHDPETEEDTASGGAPAAPDKDTEGSDGE